jgi:hypothetical protein
MVSLFSSEDQQQMFPMYTMVAWVKFVNCWIVESEVTVKELEYTLLQDSMDKELLELNEKLEQKEVIWWLIFNLPSFMC